MMDCRHLFFLLFLVTADRNDVAKKTQRHTQVGASRGACEGFEVFKTIDCGELNKVFDQVLNQRITLDAAVALPSTAISIGTAGASDWVHELINAAFDFFTLAEKGSPGEQGGAEGDGSGQIPEKEMQSDPLAAKLEGELNSLEGGQITADEFKKWLEEQIQNEMSELTDVKKGIAGASLVGAVLMWAVGMGGVDPTMDMAGVALGGLTIYQETARFILFKEIGACISEHCAAIDLAQVQDEMRQKRGSKVRKSFTANFAKSTKARGVAHKHRFEKIANRFRVNTGQTPGSEAGVSQESDNIVGVVGEDGSQIAGADS